MPRRHWGWAAAPSKNSSAEDTSKWSTWAAVLGSRQRHSARSSTCYALSNFGRQPDDLEHQRVIPDSSATSMRLQARTSESESGRGRRRRWRARIRCRGGTETMVSRGRETGAGRCCRGRRFSGQGGQANATGVSAVALVERLRASLRASRSARRSVNAGQKLSLVSDWSRQSSLRGDNDSHILLHVLVWATEANSDAAPEVRSKEIDMSINRRTTTKGFVYDVRLRAPDGRPLQAVVSDKARCGNVPSSAESRLEPRRLDQPASFEYHIR